MSVTIHISEGVGEACTEVAAFDCALQDAGIADYNLIALSSIIPIDARIVLDKRPRTSSEFGNKLYVVLATARETVPGNTASAGIGWVLANDGSGRGLFTEHHGTSEDEVQTLIRKTLEDMTERREQAYGPVQEKVVSITCTDKPVCALVAASYTSEGW